MTANYSAYFTLDSNLMTAITAAAHGAAAACGIEGVPAGTSGDAYEAEQLAQATLVHDIFGNVFRPTSLMPTCKTSEVVSLAAAAYAEREATGFLETLRLAVLADALEELGCTDTSLLAHLRSPGPHVRGCWALDLLTGRGP